MLNIQPNLWINPEAIESLHFSKDSVHGDHINLVMVSGKAYTITEKVNEIMRDIENYFNQKVGVPEAKPKKERKKREKNTSTLSTTLQT